MGVTELERQRIMDEVYAAVGDPEHRIPWDVVIERIRDLVRTQDALARIAQGLAVATEAMVKWDEKIGRIDEGMVALLINKNILVIDTDTKKVRLRREMPRIVRSKKDEREVG